VRYLAGTLLLLLTGVVSTGQGELSPLLEIGDDHLRANRIDQAIEAYHDVLRHDPMHDGAYIRLRRIDKARKLPDAPAQRDRLAREFPEGFYLRQTDHYLILYDAHHGWADTRATLLETTHDVFLREMRRAGFRPLPIRHRLEAVLFHEHRDYAAYARRVDGIQRAWSAGYYTARSNRLIVFNFHTSPLMEDLLTAMRKAEATVERRKGEVGANPGRRGALRAAERDMLIARKRYETAAAWGNIKQTLHEAVHQLAFNTRIQRPDVQYPMWFSEGLATCFETTHPAAPFGPRQLNASRLHQLNEARKRRDSIPLERFVTMTDPPDEEAARNAAYAQSWALFHMLFNERPEQLRAYVTHMLTATPGPRDADQLRADFVAHFGQLGGFADEWKEYVTALNK